MLFDRQVKLVVGDLDLSAVDMTFNISKSLGSEPNTANITVYNLTKQQRGDIVKQEKVAVQLSAGYRGNPLSVLFLGNVRDIQQKYDGTDHILTLDTGDGEEQQNTSIVKKSFGRNTQISRVIKFVANELGLGIGNLEEALSKIETQKTRRTTFKYGYTCSGKATKELDNLTHSVGLNWSIQNKVLQFLYPEETLANRTVLLSPSTGLLDYPVLASDGTISVQCLMNADIAPGRQVEIKSDYVNGHFKVTDIQAQGDTSPSSDDWTMTVDAESLN